MAPLFTPKWMFVKTIVQQKIINAHSFFELAQNNQAHHQLSYLTRIFLFHRAWANTVFFIFLIKIRWKWLQRLMLLLKIIRKNLYQRLRRIKMKKQKTKNQLFKKATSHQQELSKKQEALRKLDVLKNQEKLPLRFSTIRPMKAAYETQSTLLYNPSYQTTLNQTQKYRPRPL